MSIDKLIGKVKRLMNSGKMPETYRLDIRNIISGEIRIAKVNQEIDKCERLDELKSLIKRRDSLMMSKRKAEDYLKNEVMSHESGSGECMLLPSEDECKICGKREIMEQKRKLCLPCYFLNREAEHLGQSLSQKFWATWIQ